MTRSRALLRALGAITASILAIGSVRTATFGGPEVVEATAAPIEVSSGAAERLAGAIMARTISHSDPSSVEASAFADLHAHLETAFPRIHAALHRETVAEHSLLYRWQGSDPSLAPILLAAHLDVVPVEPGTDAAWTYAPFAGTVADGYVWGRGAIDDKSSVVGLLEATEMLLAEGVQPSRTVYFAFGHDEEVGGTRGAAAIASLLRERGVTLDLVLDEGGVIADGLLPGVTRPVALVVVAERGFLSVELSARAEGGHSSLPPSETAIGLVSGALTRLESRPMPARLEEPTVQLLERIGPELPAGGRALLANLWITRGLVLDRMAATPATNAMVRTTIAPTVLQAGGKDNVLPERARAIVNVRILPGDSVHGALAHVRETVNDERVDVRDVGAFSAEPSAVSSSASESFRRVELAIRRTVPDAIVAPYLVVGATDARHYADMSDSVLRFLPVRLTQADLDGMHGSDERISIASYEAAIRTYREILLQTTRR
jgi:carboxypeptidase PM20D1